VDKSVTLRLVPKLWNETIEEHRRAVRDATLDTTAALVAKHGLRAVTMSQIAQETGIGRATLYKYYPDVESILIAWHERLIAEHLSRLTEVRHRGDLTASERLAAVLEMYALILHEHRGSELAALLHQGPHFDQAQQHLHRLVADMVADGAAHGELRQDVGPDELAAYCLYAASAATTLSSKAAVKRLIDVTLGGLRPSETARLSRRRTESLGE
jgi:AcrR family transcriptional regulator